MTTGFSQTKKIAFESHSGNMKNFSIALNNELFDSEHSDFGEFRPLNRDIAELIPVRWVHKLDSVIVISDTMLALVAGRYSRLVNAASDSADQFAGTIYPYYKFYWVKKNNPVESFKQQIKKDKFYELRPNTVFKGFEKKGKECPVVQEALPLLIIPGPPDNNSPFDPQLMVMIGSILLLSLTGGCLSWRFYKPRLQAA